MVLLANVILILGFCTATVGAGGFARTPEPLAWPLFLGGLAVTALGGGLLRRLRAAGGGKGQAPAGRKAGFLALMEAIRDRIVELDEQKDQLPSKELCRRIDELLRGEYFDLTSRSEELVGLVGFRCYARVWEGVAVAERLLSRAWSISTDGWHDDAVLELPILRQEFEAACREMAAV
ncbi:MAG: hypothetical protein ACE5H3_10750 [Planctomycetota bacterium]